MANHGMLYWQTLLDFVKELPVGQKDWNDSSGCQYCQITPRGQEHGHPGHGHAGNAVGHHDHEEGHSAALYTTILND